MRSLSIAATLVALIGATSDLRAAPTHSDREIVASLDRAFQAAVKANDAQAMDRILHPDYVLVLGNGSVQSREDLLAEARRHEFSYEIQDEDPGTQTIRFWGDTAVVTARLHIKGTRNGQVFDRSAWFSDTYVRTTNGWKYAFGQASLPLPTGAH